MKEWLARPISPLDAVPTILVFFALVGGSDILGSLPVPSDTLPLLITVMAAYSLVVGAIKGSRPNVFKALNVIWLIMAMCMIALILMVRQSHWSF